MDDDVEIAAGLEHACRLCLTTDQTRTSIFAVPERSLPFDEKISTCLSIQVSPDDKLPTLVCETCITRINQWYSYKDTCLKSQEKLQLWFSKKLVTIKSEPIDTEYVEENTQASEEKINNVEPKLNSMDIDPKTNDELSSKNNAISNTNQLLEEEEPTVEIIEQNSFIVSHVKVEPEDTEDDYDDNDDDNYIDDPPNASEPRKELLLNPLAKQAMNKKNRIIEADSTQKLVPKRVVAKKKIRRSTRTHFRGVKLFKKKCIHCKINLHSKFSYRQHMFKIHGVTMTRPIVEKKQNLNNVEQIDNVEPVSDFSSTLTAEEKEYEKMIESNKLTALQLNIISQLKTFSCYTCNSNFFDRRHTLNHIRLHTPDLRPFTCIACLTAFSDRSMYKLHCNASFECALKIALVVPKSGEEKYFTCNMCLRSFNNRTELLDHLAIHSHKQAQKSPQSLRPLPKLKPITSSFSNNVDASDNSGPYANGDPAHNHQCDLCGMIYKYKPNMFKHRELCLTLPEHIRTSYRCAHCNMTYLVFQKFYTHIYQEHKTRVITCYTCQAMFQSSDDYLTHHETHRVTKDSTNMITETESEQVNDTDSFNNPSDSSHQPIDSTDKSFNCALCNKSFASPLELSEHRNLHLKVKIYSCVLCTNMFSNAGALAQHMKEHGIEDSGDQTTNKINLENNQLNDSQTSLNKSLLTDSTRKHKCSFCGKTFSNYPNVKRHERNLHLRRKRRWSCHLCKRRFKSVEHYESHLKIDHGPNRKIQVPAAPVVQVSASTGRPMMQCPKCPRSFAYQGNLIIHCQNIHKENHFERAIANSATAAVIQPPLPPPPPIVPAPPVNSNGYSCDICGKTFREEHSLKVHRGWHLRANMRLKSDINNERIDENLLIPEITITPVPSSPKPAKARKSFPNIPPLKQLEKIASLQCQVCDDRFSDVTELRNHLWNVHCSRNKPEPANLQCELCSVKVSDEVSLENHMKWHSQNPVVSNNQNNEDSIVSESSLLDPAKPFYCEICGKYYSNQKVFLRHKKLHKVLPAKAIMNFQSLHSKRNYCQPCQKNFSTEASLRRHKASPCHIYTARAQQLPAASSKKITTTALVHYPPSEPMDIPEIKKEPGVDDSQVTNQLEIPEQQLLQKKRPVRCHICEVVFPNMSVLYRHKQVVHNKVHYLSRPANPATPTDKCMPIATPDGLVSCNVCGKKFPGVSNLKQHFSHKHKPKGSTFSCFAPGCKLVFTTANALKIHEASHSSIIFNCNMCDRHVFTRNAIIKHMHNTHKAIYQSGANKETLWTETDLTNYNVKNCQSTSCPKCKVKYPNLRALKIHYLKYHDKA